MNWRTLGLCHITSVDYDAVINLFINLNSLTFRFDSLNTLFKLI